MYPTSLRTLRPGGTARRPGVQLISEPFHFRQFISGEENIEVVVCGFVRTLVLVYRSVEMILRRQGRTRRLNSNDEYGTDVVKLKNVAQLLQRHS